MTGGAPPFRQSISLIIRLVTHFLSYTTTLGHKCGTINIEIHKAKGIKGMTKNKNLRRAAFVFVISLLLSLIFAFNLSTDNAMASTIKSTIKSSERVIASPENVKAASYGYSKIRVSWEEAEDADGYTVYRSSSKNGRYRSVYTTENPEKNWYVNTNRKSGKVWWYTVRSYKNIDGQKVFSKSSEKVSAYARPAKTEITFIESEGFLIRFLDLNWKKVEGASMYQLSVRVKGESSFSFVGNFKETNTTFEIPDTTKEYEFRVRAVRKVNGKKVYGKFSKTASYSFDWDASDLKETAEKYLVEKWPDATFEDKLSSGELKTPYNGTSWIALWPKRFCRYEKWETVRENLMEAIDDDIRIQDYEPQDICIYIEPEEEVNWVKIYMLH